MKLKHKTLILIFALLSVFMSCKNEKTEVSIIKKDSRIDTLAVFSFRRSYVDHHLMSKKELDQLYNSNPVSEEYSYNKQEINLLSELKKLKILAQRDLILKRFEDVQLEKINHLDLEKKVIFKYSRDLTKSNSVDLIIEKNNIVTRKKIDFEKENFIGMILEDVDNDGVKEIMILLNYYIMNGDNYILMINKFIE